MKRILFAFLLGMLTIICASAQELKVLELEETDDVLSADKQRRDLNGNICAVVNVQLPIQGVVFQGNLIGDTPFVANGYQVYMTPGSKMLEVKCPGHYDKRIIFADYGIESLSSKRIYRLKLQGTAEREEKGRLILKVIPSNAQVSIDNVDYDPVGGIITLDLPAGNHSYMAAAPGYKMQTNIFNVIKDSDNKVVVELDKKQSTPSPTTQVASQPARQVEPKKAQATPTPTASNPTPTASNPAPTAYNTTPTASNNNTVTISRAGTGTVTRIGTSNGTVKGNIRDDKNGEPLVGCAVMIEGATRGWFSDIDGNYTIENVKSGDTLVFSYIGYKTKKVSLKKDVPATLNVTLKRGKGTDKVDI